MSSENGTEQEKLLHVASSTGLDWRGLRIRLVTREADWRLAKAQMEAVKQLFLEGMLSSARRAEADVDSIGLLSAAPLVCCVEGSA